MDQHGDDSQSLDMSEMSLREHLLAAQAAGAHAEQLRSANVSDPRNNIDPAITGEPFELGNDTDHLMENTPALQKGKRELSTTKRAAQNRAAQRAFRQRKEGYIKKLEEQVRSFNALQESYKQLQTENYQLRDYVIALQSRLIESQGDFPQPPHAIDLHSPRPALVSDLSELQQHISGAANAAGAVSGAPTAVMEASEVSQLQAAAAQAGEYVAAVKRRQNRSGVEYLDAADGYDAHEDVDPALELVDGSD